MEYNRVRLHDPAARGQAGCGWSMANAEDPAVTAAADREAGPWVISDCHFRKTATEYDRKTGIKWLSCTEKRQPDITLGGAPQ